VIERSIELKRWVIAGWYVSRVARGWCWEPAVLDDEALPVADDGRELRQRLAGAAERPPGVDLAAQEVREAERVERVALDRGRAVPLAGAGRDLGVHRVDRVPPGEVLDEQALPSLDGDADPGRITELSEGLPELFEPSPVVGDANLERRPAPGVEGVDLPSSSRRGAAHPERSSCGARSTSPSPGWGPRHPGGGAGRVHRAQALELHPRDLCGRPVHDSLEIEWPVPCCQLDQELS
jgi:hypothetical protein